MTDAQVMEVLFGALAIAARLAGPILVATLLIGVVVSVLQTITQIQEMTLTFVPKLLAAAGILILGGSWMIRELVAWVTQLWESIASLT
jgi:flagellar biosynthetic protein FliQ